MESAPGLQLSNTLEIDSNLPPSLLVVRFHGDNSPFISSSHAGSVEQLTSVDSNRPSDSDLRTYRLILDGLICDFSSADELAFAVYARGAERLRPDENSESIGPKIARVHNPVPPAEPVLTTGLGFTSLPDATGFARGLLKWPASPQAAGYAIWEATETALRVTLNAPSPDSDPSVPLLSRAAELEELLTSTDEAEEEALFTKSLEAFTRINTELAKEPRFEVQMPGKSDIIHAYRVSVVSPGNLESARSRKMAMFAVPRRKQPGQPKALLRTLKAVPPGTTDAIAIVAVPGEGHIPDGYRAYRVRSRILVDDVGLMGPPKIEQDDPNWKTLRQVLNDSALIKLHSLIRSFSESEKDHGKVILDHVSKSWFPYFYRVVALGAESLAEGEYSGESIPSALQQVIFAPDGPPLLDILSSDENQTNRIIKFNADLPTKLSPLGSARIDLFSLILDASTNRFKRQTLLSIATDKIIEGDALTLLDNPDAVELAAMPEIVRSAPDSSGVAEYSVRVSASLSEGVIVAADPLGRSVERVFPEGSS